MDKQMKSLLIVALILGGFWYLGGGTLPVVPQAVQQTPAAVVTDGVTIYSGIPTIEWYVTDAITSKIIAPGLFRVKIGASEADKEGDDTLNAAIGDSYTVCLMPNSTYYSTCKSGTVSKTTEKVNLSAYAIGTATIWINNDPENGTARNAVTAPDIVAASDTDTPTVCIQGASANASYGDGAFLIAIDYNSTQVASEPTLSVGTKRNELRPDGYSVDVNGGVTSVFYEVTGTLTNQQTVCGILTIEGSDTDYSGFAMKHPAVRAFDRAMFRHSTTDVLTDAYARPTSGVDTNSATNATRVFYYRE